MSDSQATCNVFVQAGSSLDCTGGVHEVQLSLAFTLGSPYTAWRSPDLTPWSGTGTGLFQTTLNHSLRVIGDAWTVEFEATKEAGADPTPITFRLGAPGAKSRVLTAFGTTTP